MDPQGRGGQDQGQDLPHQRDEPARAPLRLPGDFDAASDQVPPARQRWLLQQAPHLPGVVGVVQGQGRRGADRGGHRAAHLQRHAYAHDARDQDHARQVHRARRRVRLGEAQWQPLQVAAVPHTAHRVHHPRRPLAQPGRHGEGPGQGRGVGRRRGRLADVAVTRRRRRHRLLPGDHRARQRVHQGRRLGDLLLYEPQAAGARPALLARLQAFLPALGRDPRRLCRPAHLLQLDEGQRPRGRAGTLLPFLPLTPRPTQLGQAPLLRQRPLRRHRRAGRRAQHQRRPERHQGLPPGRPLLLPPVWHAERVLEHRPLGGDRRGCQPAVRRHEARRALRAQALRRARSARRPPVRGGVQGGSHRERPGPAFAAEARDPQDPGRDARVGALTEVRQGTRRRPRVHRQDQSRVSRVRPQEELRGQRPPPL
mmetsp:Transcript_9673/g.28804  ORF Transcript_9673/g.28804 Transcript_9673/m.28804 type:complete len:425 (-) Transcript_9673:1444-2718(-)